MARYTRSFKIIYTINTERNIFNFTLQFKTHGLRCHDCFWNINGIENGGSLLSAGDCGKDKSAALTWKPGMQVKNDTLIIMLFHLKKKKTVFTGISNDLISVVLLVQFVLEQKTKHKSCSRVSEWFVQQAELYLCAYSPSTLLRPVTELLSCFHTAPRSPTSRASFISTTDDSISTATSSSGCVSEPWATGHTQTA